MGDFAKIVYVHYSKKTICSPFIDYVFELPVYVIDYSFTITRGISVARGLGNASSHHTVCSPFIVSFPSVLPIFVPSALPTHMPTLFPSPTWRHLQPIHHMLHCHPILQWNILLLPVSYQVFFQHHYQVPHQASNQLYLHQQHWY